MINSKVCSFPKADFLSALLFLFFIQQITFLVESIYMLNLLNTQMDIRVGGISFLLLPGLLYTLKHKKATYIWIVVAMLVCLFLSSLLSSTGRIFSSGIGAGLFLTYLGLQLSDKYFPRVKWGQSIAFATLLSMLFRLAGFTQDISVTGSSKVIGWALIMISLILLFSILKGYPEKAGLEIEDFKTKSTNPFGLSIIGLAGSFILIYFVFSSPGVIARWTESDNILIHIILSISILIIVFLTSQKILSITASKRILIIWNIVFLLLFTLNILLHRIAFPTLNELAPVVVEHRNNLQLVVNYLMLLLSPVIFINIALFAREVLPAKPIKVAFPMLLSVALIIICIFMLIFTNTWGYVGSVSKIFRNQFYLPFFIAGMFMILPYIFVLKNEFKSDTQLSVKRLNKVIAIVLVACVCGYAIDQKSQKTSSSGNDSSRLTLMTYNIQQGVDLFGNKNFEGQLARIKEINPDILCLQESDASRISGGNSDVVHYFSINLGYYSYYGPKTITGTYGTAILSRFPLQNTRTIFTYSSKDEIGTAIAEVSVGGRAITIINSHPAGNKKSREEHIDMVISVAQEREHVIAMGDYNFRQESPYYQKVTKTLNDSWLSIYPDAIGPIDMSKIDPRYKDRKTSGGQLLGNGTIDMKSRIDHIFLSDGFKVIEAHYLPAPESETDHPLHWAAVRFMD